MYVIAKMIMNLHLGTFMKEKRLIVGIDLQDISDLSTEYFPKVSEILGSKDISFIESISDFATELLTDGATKVTIQNQELARLRNQESTYILEELNNIHKTLI